MKRKIIQIDKEKCNGCGACAKACHEGAIAMVDGKAQLIRDDYCDGLGDCLPVCPTNAIVFTVREALAYDEEAVLKHKESTTKPSGCPGMLSKMLHRASATTSSTPAEEQESCLSQWPVQIKLAPTKAPYFDKADLLIAADCTAYAYAGFHQKFMNGRVTLVGCPKLDSVDYSEKLAEIFRLNDLQSICLVRMQVPCCGGMEHAIKKALLACQKDIPLEVITLTLDGKILNN